MYLLAPTQVALARCKELSGSSSYFKFGPKYPARAFSMLQCSPNNTYIAGQPFGTLHVALAPEVWNQNGNFIDRLEIDFESNRATAASLDKS